jgi:predicted Zn-dependent protease
MTHIARAGLLAVVLSGCLQAQPTTPTGSDPMAASKQQRPSAEALFARGMELAQRGDAVRAEQYLALAVDAGYPYERAIVPLVRVCIASARLRAALNHAQAFLRRHPDAWPLRYLTAAVYLALDRPGDALDELRRVLRARPHAAQAHYLMGVTLRDAYGDLTAARASFDAYLRHDPRGVHVAEVSAWLSEAPRASEAQTPAIAAAAEASP